MLERAPLVLKVTGTSGNDIQTCPDSTVWQLFDKIKERDYEAQSISHNVSFGWYCYQIQCMCSDFSRKSMICAWSKVPTRSGGNCMDQDLTWNWWTLRDSANVLRYTTITDPNNHPPHIDINRQVWNPKIWQSHVNYRFWSGWVVPRRQRRPRWGKTGGSTARRPPRMFFILYDGAPVCTRQLQITNRRTN